MRGARVLLVGIAVCSLFAACGDKVLSKAEYVKRGNAICAKAQKRFEALFENGFPVLQSDVPAFFKKATPIVREQVEELRDLATPSGDSATIDKFLDEGDKAVADYERGERDAKFGAKVFSEEGAGHARAFEDQAGAYGLTACKEEDEEENSKPKDLAAFSPEKRAFIAKADPICQRFLDAMKPLEETTFSLFPPDIDGWARFIPKAVPLERTQIADLRKLTPPAADKAHIEDLWNKRSATIDIAEAAGKAAVAKDEAALRTALEKIFPGFDESDSAIRDYGFQVCGTSND